MFNEGEVLTYAYLVKTGKPCALVTVKKCDVSIFEKEIEELYGLHSYIENLNNDYVSLWIYKDNYMLDIIKNLPDKPNTPYEHWILGKAFGYSDEAIKEFIEKLNKED